MSVQLEIILTHSPYKQLIYGTNNLNKVNKNCFDHHLKISHGIHNIQEIKKLTFATECRQNQPAYVNSWMGRPSADYKYGDINIIISRCTLNVLFTYTNSKFFSWFNIIPLNVLKSPSKMHKQVQSLRLCQDKKWWISLKHGEVGKMQWTGLKYQQFHNKIMCTARISIKF